jgi:glycolate oxidase FAD binding subunit
VSSPEWKPATTSDLVQLVTENHRTDRHPLVPVGGRTALAPPVPENGTLIDMTPIEAVIDYPARDMTITVEAGMRFDALQRRLAAEHQCLPIDVPQSDRATVGGAIATNAGGPRRYGHGIWRDYVIGISAVDGQGRLFAAGGRVVKNVAGYDLCKLLIGSRGTLAIITHVTLKLRPLPESRAFLCLPCDDTGHLDRLLETLNLSRTRPVVLDVLNAAAVEQLQQTDFSSGPACHGSVSRAVDAEESRLTGPWHALEEGSYHLCIGYEGTQREVAWQLETVADEIRGAEGLGETTVIEGEPAERWQRALTEFQVLSGQGGTVQATLVPSKSMEFVQRGSDAGLAVQAHAGNGVVLAHLPEACRDATALRELLEPLHQFVVAHQGALTLHRAPQDVPVTDLSAWSPFGPESKARGIMRGIKQVLDPAGVLNPHHSPTTGTGV